MEFLSLLANRDKILIHVKPKSRKTEILSYDADADIFLVAVKAPPVDGKANELIEKYFSKLLKRPFRIKTGKTSKKKLLEVA